MADPVDRHLRLSIRNDLGQLQDADSVRWTVYRPDGSAASGSLLPAVRRGVGTYYANWDPRGQAGAFHIVWDVSAGSGSRRFTHGFAVGVPDSLPTGADASGLDVFIVGSTLVRGDAFLRVKDPSGLPADAYSVTWHVTDLTGLAVTARSLAVRAGPGEYYAPWTPQSAGSFYVCWEWSDSPTSPTASAKSLVTVVQPVAKPVSFPCQAPVGSGVYAPPPMRSGTYPVEARALLSESGGSSDSVTVSHNFGSAPDVYVLKRVSNSWLDAVGTVDVSHDLGFTSVTVRNVTDLALDVLVRVSSASSNVPVPTPSTPGTSPPVSLRVVLSESGGLSSSVSVVHPFGSSPDVRVYKASGLSWLDATGSVDVSHDPGFTTVTVSNATNVQLDVLIVISDT